VPKQTDSRMYLFQANATGVAGQIVQPFNEVIPVQAASALAVHGGFGSSRIGRFEHKNVLSFDSAYTEVSGSEVDDGVYETVALSVVENFNLLDVVRCDRIIGRLAGRHPLPGENSIVPAGSVFEGLRIGERFFEKLEVAPDFFVARTHATWSGLVEAVENDRERRLLESFSLPRPGLDPVSLLILGERKHLLGFHIALGAPASFTVPGFGTVHLGEFFCEPTSRRLIMLRAELDGAVQGQVVVGDPIVDGGGYPP
jgi:hypothetical protein